MGKGKKAPGEIVAASSSMGHTWLTCTPPQALHHACKEQALWK